jgi:hypothetical protein
LFGSCYEEIGEARLRFQNYGKREASTCPLPILKLKNIFEEILTIGPFSFGKINTCIRSSGFLTSFLEKDRTTERRLTPKEERLPSSFNESAYHQGCIPTKKPKAILYFPSQLTLRYCRKKNCKNRYRQYKFQIHPLKCAFGVSAGKE